MIRSEPKRGKGGDPRYHRRFTWQPGNLEPKIPLGRLLGEFRRRSLLQPLGVYLAGSWVALQIIDIVVDSLDLPRWLPALAILLIVGGLPVILATAYLQRGGGEETHGSGAASLDSTPAEDPV